METNATIQLVATACSAQGPTLESTWHAVAGGPITDEFLEWPADLFALTDVILERTEAYRFVLSPPSGLEWPPSRFSNWSDAVEAAVREWNAWLDDRDCALPDLLSEEWGVFRRRVAMPLEDVAEGHDLRMCEALLTLHAIADEGCAGLGVALDRSDGKGFVSRARGRELLARTGSISRIQSCFLRVSAAGVTRALWCGSQGTAQPSASNGYPSKMAEIDRGSIPAAERRLRRRSSLPPTVRCSSKMGQSSGTKI
jgi:hypothetical protein